MRDEPLVMIRLSEIKKHDPCADQFNRACELFPNGEIEVSVELAQQFAHEFDFGWLARKLLKAPAWAEYARVTAPAWAEYARVRAPALDRYKRVEAPAWAEYERVRAPAWAEYQRFMAAAFAMNYLKQARQLGGT